MLPVDFTITRARVWNSEGDLGLRKLRILGGRLVSLEPSSMEESFPSDWDLCGQLLLPVGVDPQVHLRVPGQPEKETADTGLRAALHGGIGAVLTMPNTKPVIDCVEVLESARRDVEAAEDRYGVKVFWSAALTLGQMGKTCVDFDRLAEAGVRAFTDDGKGLVDDGLMEQCLEASARLGLPILQHAEFPGHGGLLAPSNVQSQLKVGAYAEDAEVLMVERDLGLLKKHPEARYHVLHVSSGKTVERLRQAQQNGLKASGEASPHHLMYTVDEINPSDTSWKMNPPLRTLGDREALREGLRSGVLSFVATDHAPHESSAKGLGFQEAPFGTTGLEAMLKVLLNLHKNNELSVKRLVEVWSFMAARFFGFEGFGDLKVGDTFRAVWVDLDAPPRPLQTRDLQSLSKNSLFLGRQFPTEIRGVFNTKGFFRF